MSKHINLVISDTMYSSLIAFMNDNNISNLSFAVRYLLRRQLDLLPDSYATYIEEQKDIQEWCDDFVKNYAPELFDTDNTEVLK